jgi:hypothetical protein
MDLIVPLGLLQQQRLLLLRAGRRRRITCFSGNLMASLNLPVAAAQTLLSSLGPHLTKSTRELPSKFSRPRPQRSAAQFLTLLVCPECPSSSTGIELTSPLGDDVALSRERKRDALSLMYADFSNQCRIFCVEMRLSCMASSWLG